ncbi:hypothetical protein [Candidatus Pantoea multigeneris]|uniref:Uncharacterized protein n=1 Tax=Candidatus Pantoea multigeneris TaxID=2608357 RepID=A0ABX0RKV7_9GAMM|nr:hypothetical protein [Pantoea multigeneris]NIF24044.1 hypothetical protein [Pantoea multigeneris]
MRRDFPRLKGSPESEAALLRVLGVVSFISLDNGDEALYINARLVAWFNAETDDKSLMDFAFQTARALSVSMRSFDLATPENPEWDWNEVTEALAAGDQTEVRAEIMVQVKQTDDGKKVHFCDDHRLGDRNRDRWFTMAEGVELSEYIEQFLTDNGVAQKVERITPIYSDRSEIEWQVIYLMPLAS